MRRHDLTKKYLPTYIPTHLPTYLPTYVPPLENTLKERSKRLVTFETFDQSDEETWPDRQIQIQRQSPFKTIEALVYLLSLKKSSLQIIPMCNITHFSNRDKRAILKLNLDGKMAFPILNTFITPFSPQDYRGRLLETFGVQVFLYVVRFPYPLVSWGTWLLCMGLCSPGGE